jgi:signal transduction histidine kinase
MADNAFGVGLIFDMSILSLAMVDRISLIQTERVAAQQLALESQQKLSEHLRTAKESLELEVEKRTQELRLAKERTEEATKLKDKYLGLVTHDLKGPISAISGLMHTSLRKNADHDLVHKCVARVYETSLGLIEMINRLLDINRLQTGSIQLDKTSFDVLQLSQETVAKVSPLAEMKGITLVNDIPSGMILSADKTLAGEVLINLLTNAIKFTRETGTIRIFSLPNGTIAVSDTGVGVPQNVIPDLFKHDVRTVGVGTKGEVGTGIGLPFCQDIMRAHGGILRVETGPTGSTFFAEFPAP